VAVAATPTKRNGSVSVVGKAQLMLTRQIHQAVVRPVREGTTILEMIVDLEMVRMTVVPLIVPTGLPVIRTTVSNMDGVTGTPAPELPIRIPITTRAITTRRVTGLVIPIITIITTAGVVTTTAEVVIIITAEVETAVKRLPRLTFGSRFSRRTLGCRATSPTGVLTVDVIAGTSAKKIAVY
jgi:hypothetical protein